MAVLPSALSTHSRQSARGTRHSSKQRAASRCLASPRPPNSRAPMWRGSSPRVSGASQHRRRFAIAILARWRRSGGNRRSQISASFRLSGFIAWLLWGVVHVYFLVGFRNRVAVLIGRLWAYVTFERGARLITGHDL